MDTNKARKCRGGSACHTHTLDEAGKYPVIETSDHANPVCQCSTDEEADERVENDLSTYHERCWRASLPGLTGADVLKLRAAPSQLPPYPDLNLGS